MKHLASQWPDEEREYTNYKCYHSKDSGHKTKILLVLASVDVVAIITVDQLTIIVVVNSISVAQTKITEAFVVDTTTIIIVIINIKTVAVMVLHVAIPKVLPLPPLQQPLNLNHQLLLLLSLQPTKQHQQQLKTIEFFFKELIVKYKFFILISLSGITRLSLKLSVNFQFFLLLLILFLINL